MEKKEPTGISRKHEEGENEREVKPVCLSLGAKNVTVNRKKNKGSQRNAEYVLDSRKYRCMIRGNDAKGIKTLDGKINGV